MTVLVFAPHSDDEVIGAGGTIAKYVKEGKKVVLVIFSYGEQSDPIKKNELVINERKKEAEDVKELLGISKIIFLGVPDSKFWWFGGFKADKKLIKKVKEIISEYNPKEVFIPSKSDAHQDHRKAHKLLMKVLKDKKISVYSYSVWSPIKLFNHHKPRLYVDISNTFDLKMKALGLFKSQGLYIDPLIPSIRVRAIKAGADSGCKYAEVFYKIK